MHDLECPYCHKYGIDEPYDDEVTVLKDVCHYCGRDVKVIKIEYYEVEKLE